MTGNQKYRTRANIGHAYLALEQDEKAAHCFLYAKQYDPENEKARAREALKDYRKQNLTTSIVRALLRRATVRMGLNNHKAMEEDVLFAYQVAPLDREVVFRYASMKAKEKDWDGAIKLLETLISKGLSPLYSRNILAGTHTVCWNARTGVKM